MAKRSYKQSYEQKDKVDSDKRRSKSTPSQRSNENYLRQAGKLKAEQKRSFPFDPHFVCPTGCNMTETAPPLFGPTNHVLHVKLRPDPEFIAIFDIESWAFHASVLQHAVLLLIDPNQESVGEDAFGRVKVIRTWGDVVSEFKELLARLYVTQMSKGVKRGRGKILAHNGAGFDWSGLAKYLGIDINTDSVEDYFIEGKKAYKPIIIDDELDVVENAVTSKHKMRWTIENFGDKPRIYLSCGSQNAFVLELLDSFWIMNVPLSQLGSGGIEKGVTPLQYTDPVKWMNDEGFKVTHEDVHPYIDQAHRYELTPEGKWAGLFEFKDGLDERVAEVQVYDQHPNALALKDEAFKAILHWKQHLGDKELLYSKTDVVVLANALCRFFALSRQLGVPNPASFNTAAMIGLAAMVNTAYESSMDIDRETKQLKPRFKLKHDRYGSYEKGQMRLLTSEDTKIIKSGGKLSSKKAAEEEPDFDFDDFMTEDLEYEPLAKEIRTQHHGYVESKSNLQILMTNPWYCSRAANQLFRIVQRGGRCEVWAANNMAGTSVVVLDAKSMYPSVMADGVKFWIKDLQEWSNVLRGFIDPRLLRFGANDNLETFGLVTKRKVTRKVTEWDYSKLQGIKESQPSTIPGQTENFEDVAPGGRFSDALVIKEVTTEDAFVCGRINALKLLQIRGGMFYCRLPRTKCDFFRKYPIIPQQLGGGDIENRAVYADWQGILETYCTAEELVLFLSEETEDDDAVEINLERSLHSSILGIYTKMKDGKPTYSGKGWSPFSKFVRDTYSRRRSADTKVKEIEAKIEALAAEAAISGADPAIKSRLLAEADAARAEGFILKLLMNAGGYGPLAQQHSPQFDFPVESLSQAIEVMRRIAVQDPDWDRISNYVAHFDHALKSFDENHESYSGDKPAWANIIQRILQLEVHLRPFVAQRARIEMKIAKAGGSIEGAFQTALGLSRKGDRGTALDILGVADVEGEVIEGIDPAWREVLTRLEALNQKIDIVTRIITGLLVDYGESHLCTYEHYPSIDPMGRHIKRFMISLPDSTASHAIRPWAVSVTAKSRVSLHLGMRAVHDAGNGQTRLLYGDTDSIHFSVPYIKGEDPEITARRILSGNSYITIGRDLGMWDFEAKFVRADLAIAGHESGSKVVCRHAYYASKKVYMFCDEHFNILDCRARGVPRINSRMQASMVGYVMRISKLGDRQGISASNFRVIRLASKKPIQHANELGDEEQAEIPGLFAGFNRHYPDRFDSFPAVFDGSDLGFTKGQMVNAEEVSRAYTFQISVKGREHAKPRSLSEFRNGRALPTVKPAPLGKLQGMQDGYDFYMQNYLIGGLSVSTVRRDIEKEIGFITDLFKLNGGKMSNKVRSKLLGGPNNLITEMAEQEVREA